MYKYLHVGHVMAMLYLIGIHSFIIFENVTQH